ncbi:hypothetical protein TCDM_08121 [Trypanosoma cruzi Dm28c]|uniref:Uncharacterized protein n=1 Tax=Trypanosoma cruzi Dm28c TaxID=1416333 RepID=V5AT15_TRYCR|nr:hypothetical protein TCDM_08121 [Trypanosoma cruzi Dm28c]
MSCRCTMQRLASRTPRRPRLPWLAPALAPHQQLDAGIAARHQADRKNLKKSKRPFANYFRNEYRSSPSYSPPVTRTDGNISSYNVVRLMTDGRRTWTPFWGRATGGVRTRRKRQDVLEPPAPQFGDDDLDRIIERLLEIRFQWDLGDDILASSLVTPSLRAMTEHCLPFAPCMGSLLPSQERKQEGLLGCVELDGEQIPLYVFRGRGRRKGKAVPKVNLGFNGVDTVPSVVLDATRGPLVSSPRRRHLAYVGRQRIERPQVSVRCYDCFKASGACLSLGSHSVLYCCSPKHSPRQRLRTRRSASLLQLRRPSTTMITATQSASRCCVAYDVSPM